MQEMIINSKYKAVLCKPLHMSNAVPSQDLPPSITAGHKSHWTPMQWHRELAHLERFLLGAAALAAVPLSTLSPEQQPEVPGQ